MNVTSVCTIDTFQQEIGRRLDPSQRSRLGQFMTPSTIADFMSSLFSRWPANARLLDPGAGVGSLTESFARRYLERGPACASLEVHCFEIDSLLAEHLATRLTGIQRKYAEETKSFELTIHERDFISEASFQIGFGMTGFTHAILNPPYKKINTSSEHRKLLRTTGIETVNLYTAFLGLAVSMMEKGGEVVAIVPRSFCNGTYFRPFRKFLLDRTALTHLHVFESRKAAFKDDDILQENIIIRVVRSARQGSVIVSTSHGPKFESRLKQEVPFCEIVKPDDSERFIHIPTTEVNGATELFMFSLAQLGLAVSTGPVVDFRLKEHWLTTPTDECAPLVYAHHFKGGRFTWPVAHKKPNALKLNQETVKWLMPRGCYVVTKRFSSKEERRRLTAFVLEPKYLTQDLYGFENHLNVIHTDRHGIPKKLAHGLATYLNSTVADQYFRTFSGHTQVNATDLRSMKYPSRPTLERLGHWARKQEQLTQDAIDTQLDALRDDDQKEAD